MKKNGKSFLLVLLLLTTIINSQVTNDNQFNIQDLVNNQPISVTIGGEFIVTGSFPAYSGERVDQFITRIYNEAKSKIPYPSNNDELFVEKLSQVENYALRGITLQNQDGSKTTIDLLKFRLTGDFSNNPYLQNDDIIIFPSYNLEYNFVEIDGAVNKPAKFQFVEGDKLSDAIFFARGINQAYENVDSALISRLSYDGNEEKMIMVAIEDDLKLKRGDRIKLIADQVKRKDYKVLVLGEVINPGYVYITKYNTTLKEVIDKAGGFTENASLKDAEIIRNLDRHQTLIKHAINLKAIESPKEFITNEKEKESWKVLETLRMLRTADLLEDDTLFFNVNNQLRILESSRISDFVKLDSSNSFISDFKVKNDDVIIIPEKVDAVYVFGQVGKTGYYKFVERKDYDYYIRQAGGLAVTAKGDDDIYIIKGNSREWIKIDDGKEYRIEPGDYIYAAKEIPRDIWFYVSRIGTIAGILGSIATIVLLFK